MVFSRDANRQQAFSIVELIVVISVVAILATISVISYGAWRSNIAESQVKNDLKAAASAMEVARNTDNAFPSGIPSTVNPSNGVTLVVYSSTATSYCIDGSSTSTSKTFFIENTTEDAGAQEGTCGTSPNTPPPAAPANVSVATLNATSLTVYWNAVALPNPTFYTMQCATDTAFIANIQTASVAYPATSGSVSGLSETSTYWCRVAAVNEKGQGPWSATVSADTSLAYGSLPVGASLEGYWANPPQGFMVEDGSAISRTLYADLFSVIGTTYGAGDGSTTFNIPDSMGRTTVNRMAADSDFGTIGQQTGARSISLSTLEMPSHTHTQNSHTHTLNDPSHNHTQNAHSHEVRSSPNGDFVGMSNGSQGGWGIQNCCNNTIYRMIFDDRTATNNASTTGISVNSIAATNQNTGSGSAHNNIQPSIVKLAVIKYSPVDAGAATLPAGTSVSGYWNSAPSGYLAENGANVSRSTYSGLFSAIGTQYGTGDGSTTFTLPNSMGRASANINASDADFDTMGETRGTKQETLTVNQIPSHTHTQNSHTNTISDSGHNHTQNPHAHELRSSPNGDYVGLAGGGQGGWGMQGCCNNSIFRITPSATTATNNPSTTGISISSSTATNQSSGGDGAHSNIQPSMTKLTVIKHTAATGAGSAVAPGSSVPGYWSTVPAGYLFEDGAEVSRTTYADLFGAIGTTYGAGDGATTFNLPDSRGRIGVNKHDTWTEFDTMGEKVGAKTVTLTIPQLPSHTHIQNAHTHALTDPGHNHSQNSHNHEQRNSPNGDYTGMNNGSGGGWGMVGSYNNNNIYRIITTATTATNNAATTGITLGSTTAVNQSTGGGQSHNEIQPTIVKRFIIKF